jgi:DNA-directed RNA polymerase specialized sigma subunit
MTVQEVKAKLNSVRVKYREYILARDKAEQFREMISSPALRQSDEPRSEPDGNITENKLIAALWYSEQANKIFQEYMLLRNDAEMIISGIKYPDEREVLTRRYIMYQKWEDIAQVMHYSRQHVTRIHGSALAHLCA